MEFLINEIEMPDPSYKFIEEYRLKNGKIDTRKIDSIKNLSKVNIFVGSNNQGKSRFLRFLFINELNFKPNNTAIDNINNALKTLRDKSIDDNFQLVAGIYLQKNFDKIDFLTTNQELAVNNAIKDLGELIDDCEKSIADHEKDGVNDQNSYDTLNYAKYILKFIKEKVDGLNLYYPFKNVYIPIIRGLRPVSYCGENEVEAKPFDGYEIRTRYDYFIDLEKRERNLDDNFTISTGLNAYKDIYDYMLNESDEKQEIIEEFQEYLSINFFDNEQVKITPVANKSYNKKDVIKVKIGDEEGKLIYDLGDGIQSIIILTLPLFIHKGKIKDNEQVLVFIEEPEHLLHPGLQRKIFDLFFDDRFENFQFFFTTHSNHFLDITIDYDDISIYAFKKELVDKTATFNIENLSKGDANALELLGVRNSSVFLSNCTIWVEGITDVGYLRHYLDIYIKENPDDHAVHDIKEDYNYSFVEYGGNNITHWSFLDKEERPLNVERLCGKLFLIVDKDEGKNERHEELKIFLGDRLHVLGSREIENLVSEEILLEIVGEHEKGLENIKTDISYEDYKNKPLGKFIDEEMIMDEEKKVIKSYGTSSGTIRYKNTFLKKAKKHTVKWDDLTEDAQNLVREMYEFILKSNGYS